MNRINKWINNLKIKSKLFVILVITIVNFIIFFAFSNFFLNTTDSFTSMIDAERMHTEYFETGMASFYLYMNTNDTNQLNNAIQNIDNANRLASLMVNIDSLVANTTRNQFRDIYWDYYKVPLHNDRDKTNTFADRTRLFVWLNFSILIETYDIAAQGYNTGNQIVNLIKKYKTSPSKNILNEIETESKIIRNFYRSFSLKISEATKFGMKLLFWISLLILAVLIIINVLVINKISNHLHGKLKSLVSDSRKLSDGDLSINKYETSGDEIGWLSDSFNTIVESMKKMVSYANQISNGNYDKVIKPRSENDELAFALNAMAKSLNANKIKNEIEAWQTLGQNQLNQSISGELTIDVYAKNTLSFLVGYTESLTGTFYVNDNSTLLLKYSHGVNKSIVKNEIPLSSGIIGQVLGDSKALLLKNTNNNTHNTFTSTTEIKPKEIYIIPLVYIKDKLGVIELTSVTGFSETTIKFINSLSEMISVGLHVTLSRQKLNNLLLTTQQQAEELEVQQEELRTSNAELEEQTHQLRENELKLQAQQEELRVTNEELEERTHDLEIQKNEVIKNSKDLEQAKLIVEQKAREVEAASKYKSVFLANMSHELRTPLNSLLILSKDLSLNKNKNLSPNQVEAANIINNSGHELLNLINDILDLSKIEAGKMLVNPEYITSEDIKMDVSRSFNHMAQQKGLQLVINTSNPANLNLFNDRQKINQILKNLISNAIKFTSEGTITLDIYFEKQKNTDFCCLKVSDTGIGIPEEKQNEIFEAFKQVDGSISRNFGGTGLGLSISKEITKLLSGNISLKSKLGEGSSFSVCIPTVYHEDMLTEKTQNAVVDNQSGIHSEKHIEAAVNMNVKISEDDTLFVDDDRGEISENDKIILIIEDDLVLAKDLMLKCYEGGFKVIIAGTGENGLFLTEKYKPDAILLDIMLPGIDGYKVLEMIKENPETRHIPVHLMSSLDNNSNSFQKLAIGYLTKPLSQEDVDEAFVKISNHINKNVKDLLIIEDDEANSIMISKLLGGKDVNLTLTGSGKEALELLTNNNYDCVVLDLGLSDMSGIELVRIINTETGISSPPIIVYTARDLTKKETRELQRYTKSIIIKGVKSDGRLLDETALFLHRVVDDMSEGKKNIIKKLHNKEAIFENKTVLIVDDDMRNVFALTSILEDHSLKVIEAENGKVALKKLEEDNKVDIILMDVMMPEMDGLTATKEIRKNEKLRNIPIIVLTAKAMKEDRLKAINAGANDYLSKPVDTDKLLTLMRVWLYN